MYTVSKIPFESFSLLLLPYVLVSAVFLVVLSFFISKEKIALPKLGKVEVNRDNFLKRVFTGVDYYLLLTFIALFILIGNLENIAFFNSFFTRSIAGNEVLWGVGASQIISNVPAAMLLSGFSSNYEAIIIGINIGGFGTLIASMANLISYKILVREHGEFKIRYLIVFTVLNVALLAILFGTYLLTFQ
jgi:Na+/H+ antiporter NhaD/arsenite permease-like protein